MMDLLAEAVVLSFTMGGLLGAVVALQLQRRTKRAPDTMSDVDLTPIPIEKPDRFVRRPRD